MNKLTLILVFLLTATLSFAGSVDTFGIGSKATAMGGAYSAYADDPYAIHYNPAGLTQIKTITISAGAEYMDPTLEIHNYTAQDYNGGTVAENESFSDTSDNLLVPHLGIAVPIGDKFVFGIAAYVPFGLHVKWDDNPDKNPASYIAAESYYIREVIAPSLAFKVNEKLSIGGAILLGKTYAGEKKRIYAPGLPNHNKLVKVTMEDEFNWSINLGVQYKPIKEVVIGFTYRSKTDVNFNKGDAEVENWDGINGNVDVSGVRIDHPDQFQLGLRYIPAENFSMEIDVVYSKWSQVTNYTATFDPVLMGSTEELYSNRDWQDTTQLRIGAEWEINEMFTVRGGYFYDPSPIPDSTFDTMWPDGDRKTYSLGAGINFSDNITLDLVIQYAIAEQKRQIGGESENFNHGYQDLVTHDDGEARVELEADGHLWGYGATLTYKF